MIQRIQTIFLFLASAASLSLLKVPMAVGIPSTQIAVLADGRFTLYDHVGLLIAFAGGGILALLAIFLFRNRSLQMKLSLLSLFFILAGIGVAAYLLFNQARGLLDNFFPVTGSLLPIAAVILTLLAYRYIKKDEQLVKSMDRLR